MKSNKPSALVTGATGYVGSNLVRVLVEQGWKVSVVVRTGSKLDVLGAVLNKIVVYTHDGTTIGMIEAVKAAKPEIVFHLASLFLAQHKEEEVEGLIASNVLFSTQLVEAMAANNVCYLINTGTAWQHFDNKKYDPVNLYAATKQAFEDILLYYVNARGIKVKTLALFDTYGQNDPRSKLMSLLWKTAHEQKTLEMSPGNQFIDIVHISDVVSAFIHAASNISDQIEGHVTYGISSGKPLKLQELVKVFEAATGQLLPIVWGGRPYRFRECMVAWSDYKPLPGWEPKIPLEIGILQCNPMASFKTT